MNADEKNVSVESDDLIDRQMAVEAVRDLLKRIPVRAIRAMNAIRSLPPARPRSLDEYIRREDAVQTVKNACKKVMRECDHHYDEKIEDYVYDNVHDVDLILKVNKEAVNALKLMPATNDLISR